MSGLGAICKTSGKIRLIHDCSRPEGTAVNDYATADKIRYQTVTDASKLLTKNCFMAKVDLESAYRSVKIHKDDHEAAGLRFKFAGAPEPVYMVDTRLPFGATRAPGTFHRLPQAVRRMMARRGFRTTIVYLDDWLIIAETEEECRLALNTLLALLRTLGFSISYSKVEMPTQRLTFLGIILDSRKLSLALPQEKVQSLDTLLAEFSNKKRATRTQLQSLAGKLTWASQVVRGGRHFLRAIYNAIDCLVKPRHKLRLDYEFQEDITWWLQCLSAHNEKLIESALQRGEVAIEMDSCIAASGIVYKNDWLYTDWERDWPEVSHMHINHKEALSLVLAARRWAPDWVGKRVIIYSDNKAAVGMLNKGYTKARPVLQSLREVFWLSMQYDFIIEAVYLKGESNLFSDTVSRLTTNNYLLLWALLGQSIIAPPYLDNFVNTLILHMSPKALLPLIPQIRQLGRYRNHWIERWLITERMR